MHTCPLPTAQIQTPCRCMPLPTASHPQAQQALDLGVPGANALRGAFRGLASADRLQVGRAVQGRAWGGARARTSLATVQASQHTLLPTLLRTSAVW